jgi:hypothetical protein
MALFSYHGGIPSPLPDGLNGAAIERLEELGYKGPIPSPSFNPRTQVVKWLGEEWAVIDLSPEEIQQAEYLRLLGRADWTSFTEGLMGTSAYAKARAAAATSLQANVDCTELIAFLADARAGKPHIAGINNCFASIDQETSLTEEDKAQLYALVQNTGLGAFLVVPGYMPPELAMEGEDE